MTYDLDAAFNAALTPKERNLLIRYCISTGTRAKCSTKALCRPLRLKDLRMAFEEHDQKCLARIAECETWMRDFDPNNVPKSMRSMFGSVPSKEEFTSYCESLIMQAKDSMGELRRSYIIRVDYEFISPFWMEFHRSLSPRVTFGYSNELHEECDFWLDEEEYDQFLHSSLLDPPADRDDWMHDWGNVIFGNMELVYEDLTVYFREECMLETISHEEIMIVHLSEKDVREIEGMKGGKRLAAKIRATVPSDKN